MLACNACGQGKASLEWKAHGQDCHSRGLLDAHSDAVCRPSLFRSHRTGNLMSRQTRAPEIYTKKLRPWVARNGKARREAIGGHGQSIDSVPDWPNGEPSALVMPSERQIRDLTITILPTRMKCLLERWISTRIASLFSTL
jgi:hypothetical protein